MAAETDKKSWIAGLYRVKLWKKQENRCLKNNASIGMYRVF
jgi:hypothetical protein